MRTLTEMIEARRQPLTARWELITDANGRTRPQMRWEPTTPTTPAGDRDHAVTLAA